MKIQLPSWPQLLSKLLIFLVCFLINFKPSLAIEKTASVKVSASVGVNEVTITGYTSPNSKVELTGVNVYDQTYSQEDGFFQFTNTLLPKNYSELCIDSTDSSNNHTSPVCIPAPPHSNYYTEIGPVLLPPTLTINNALIKPGETVITSGQSIPNSQINVYFYKVDNDAKSFPKSAYAYSLPVFTTTTDSKGNFNLNLPTAYSSNFRLYAAVNHQDHLSAKSNTLLYNMPSLVWLFIKSNPYLTFLLPAILCLLILGVYLYSLHEPHKAIRFLPAIYNFFPAVSPLNSPVFYPDSLKRSHYIPA